MVGGPIGEEALFRGFLYRGVAGSRLGPGMAIGLTALAYALFKTQLDPAGLALKPDLYGVSLVYLFGLYLGLVRCLTGSTRLTVLLNATRNLVAAAGVVIS